MCSAYRLICSTPPACRWATRRILEDRPHLLALCRHCSPCRLNLGSFGFVLVSEALSYREMMGAALRYQPWRGDCVTTGAVGPILALDPRLIGYRRFPTRRVPRLRHPSTEKKLPNIVRIPLLCALTTHYCYALAVVVFVERRLHKTCRGQLFS